MLLLLAATATAAAASPPREVISFDFNWRIPKQGLSPAEPATCPPATVKNFKPTIDLRCSGLKAVPSATSEAICLDSCCADSGCEVYQFMNGTAHGDGCWTGTCSSPGHMSKGNGWMGGSRAAPAPPGPQPAHTSGPLSPGWEDSAWELIDVPHDFIIGGVCEYPHRDRSFGLLPR